MIHNFVVDYNKSTKINNIEYSNTESVNTFTKKIKFFNPEISEPLHKFWYFVPNAKLIKKSSGILTLALSSTDTNLIESLKNLDDKTDVVLKKIHQSIKSTPSIKLSQNFPPVIEACVDGESKCYDQDNKPIVFMNIKNNSKIQLYMEFDCITFGSNRCERKWRVIQMKENKPIDLNANMFDAMPPGIPSGHPMGFPQGSAGPPMMPGMHSSSQGIPQMFYPPAPHLQMPYGMQPYNPYYSAHGSSGIPPPPSMGPPPSSLLGPPPIGFPPTSGQKEDKPGPAGGSLFQPPTQDQLLSMIGKLKKPTKVTDTKKSENHVQPTKRSDDNQNNNVNDSHDKEDKKQEKVIVPQAPPLNLSNKIEPTKKNIDTKDSFDQNHIPEAPPMTIETDDIKPSDQLTAMPNVQKIDENDSLCLQREEYRKSLLKKISLLIEEQTDRLERDTIAFEKDVALARNLMQKIDTIISLRNTQREDVNENKSVKSSKSNTSNIAISVGSANISNRSNKSKPEQIKIGSVGQGPVVKPEIRSTTSSQINSSSKKKQSDDEEDEEDPFAISEPKKNKPSNISTISKSNNSN